MSKTIEDYEKINTWIKENTNDGEFATHPDFVEDAMLELLIEIETLKEAIDDISEANAHLIAAAPEMYELLQRIGKAEQVWSVNEIHEVISKAKGGG